MTKFNKIFLFFIIVQINSYAASNEEWALNLPEGLQQDTPYNSMLPTVTFQDTNTQGTPYIGCVPLALSRAMFYAWNINPVTREEEFKTINRAIHQNSSDLITYKTTGTGVNTRTGSTEEVLNRNGFILENKYRMPSATTEDDKRQRISDLYIYVRDKIKNSTPVIMASLGKHAFVIDGYKTINPALGKEDLYLHVLWGWGTTDGQWIQIDKDAGWGSWIEFADDRVQKYFKDFSFDDAILFTIKERVDYNWNGNGSVISDSTGDITGWGITYDEALIHPDSFPAVFFQWEINSKDGKNLRISLRDNNGYELPEGSAFASVRYGLWGSRIYDEEYKNIRLPFVLDPSKNFDVFDGQWMVLRVLFNQKVNASSRVFVKATNETPLDDVSLYITDRAKIDGRKWNGNASLISFNSGDVKEAGTTWDVTQIHAVTKHLGEDAPVVYFQWQIDSEDGTRLQLTATGMGRATITYGDYDDRSNDVSYRHDFSNSFYLDPSSDGKSVTDGKWYVVKVSFDNKPSDSNPDVEVQASVVK